jgi:hypothetical protein
MAEWCLHQSKLQAWRREQSEIALFKRIHAPELTQEVSFWQVAIVCSFLLSWKRRVFSTPGQHKSLNNDRELTSEERSQLLAFSEEYPTTYNSYVMEVQVGTGYSCFVYRARKADDGILVREYLITRSTRDAVAIKEICISNLPRKNLLIDEIATLKQANHRNIISFHNVVWQIGSNNVLDCGGVRGLRSVVRFD